ncbi:hypothetical protein L602_002200000180 [Cupriavidus gilardii J11]|uniref:Uncharacterized protein n=1 Tax=Cupriavidus gilardii J11 TaxID=936133 RepID=A0A562BM57_9BURK|nr:hydroxyquinol 1,2-dioxygenase [Cupriavidus gilardii]TWG85963.1 hypothetical protein L602_002200000180 [Cupriavidus gilardii J11]
MRTLTLKHTLLATSFAATLTAFAGVAQAAPHSVDPYTDGAVTSQRDIYVDGARATGPRDAFTDGARIDNRDPHSDGA